MGGALARPDAATVAAMRRHIPLTWSDLTREKYDAELLSSDVSHEIAFGYTSNEVGFGWTNAVTLLFLRDGAESGGKPESLGEVGA